MLNISFTAKQHEQKNSTLVNTSVAGLVGGTVGGLIGYNHLERQTALDIFQHEVTGNLLENIKSGGKNFHDDYTYKYIYHEMPIKDLLLKHADFLNLKSADIADKSEEECKRLFVNEVYVDSYIKPKQETEKIFSDILFKKNNVNKFLDFNLEGESEATKKAVNDALGKIKAYKKSRAVKFAGIGAIILAATTLLVSLVTKKSDSVINEALN